MEWELYESVFNENANKKVEWVHFELDKIRIGKVSPKMVENIEIKAYGEPSKLLELANILSSDSKTLLVKPYDKSIIKIIANTITKLNLGGNLQADADVIRITFQPPTEETRKQAALKVKKVIEQGKVFIRDVRHAVLNDIKKDEELHEDNLHWYKEEIDSVTKKFTTILEEIQDKKIESVMTI